MTDERDDEILGRALARAIETQDVDETPYDSSRIAARPGRRGFPLWQSLAAAAALVLAVGYGSWLTRPAELSPVAASPSPAASGTPAPAASPTSTAAPQKTTAPAAVDHQRIFLVRYDGVPVGVHIDTILTAGTAAERITSRIRTLLDRQYFSTPNDIQYVAPPPNATELGSVAVSGDTVTVDFKTTLPQLGLASEVAEWIFAKEVVYTATEEPGVRYAKITVNGAAWSVSSGGGTVPSALRRESVYGYDFASVPLGKDSGISFAGTGDPRGTVLRSTGMSLQGSLARFTFEARGSDGKATAAPPFNIWMQEAGNTSLGGKYALTLEVPLPGSGSTGGAAHVEYVNQSPVTAYADAGRSFGVELDDARPWRAYMPDADHVVVEIGGDPQLVSDRIAVWNVRPGDRVSRTLAINGAARVFEATVSYRIFANDRTKIAASGFTTASVGTSSIWGTYAFTVNLPTDVVGPIVVQVYEVSAKDGTEQGVVAIPLVVR